MQRPDRPLDAERSRQMNRIRETFPVYFFGCVAEPGHHLRDPRGRMRYDIDSIQPFGHDLDSRLAPPGPGSRPGRREEIEGHAALHRRSGWTALSWWDRSVDRRGACNAALVAPGELSAEEILVLGRRWFPLIMARFAYAIVVVER